jgi:3-oxoacyl-[acyl-carrier protein] reductase
VNGLDHGFSLDGRRALVTGASTGIGAAVAVRLARAGAHVVAVSRSGRRPDYDGGSSGLGRIDAVVADLSTPAGLDGVVDDAVEILGGLDLVVNNAGRGDWRPLVDLDRSYFDGLIDLNLWAPLRICQLAHPHLVASEHAAVVMIGSVDAVRPSAGGAIYGATKAGLGAAVVALAKEWRADGIRVTQVNPGLVDTPMAADAVEALHRTGAPINLVGRAADPDEIAALVHYLVSPVGGFASGASFRVDGGAVALGPFDALASEEVDATRSVDRAETKGEPADG